ncbi:MAG TPA: hypothetical protein VH112_10690 [Acidimicrobiales bacterium]|nr:hypothetical protein [Acidimicrobiales bacterium]
MQRSLTTSGRRGAASKAVSGQVTMHAPHAVQRVSIVTVDLETPPARFTAGNPAA